MKKLLSLALLMLFATGTMFAQGMKDKKRASPHETVSGKNVKVTYGRPFKKGRDIFGGLEPWGEVWRLGADEATEITFDKDGMFGGKPIKAGTYTMFAKLGKTEWTIILNSELKQWGSFGYEKIKGKDVLQTTVPVKSLNNVVEQLTITPKDNGIMIEWDKTGVFVPMKF